MKIRNGFVSNSSSSSFILVFDKKPSSIEELIDILDLHRAGIKGHTAEEAAKIIFKDVIEDKSKTLDEDLIQEFEDHLCPDFSDKETTNRFFEQKRKEAIEMAEKFKNKNKNKYITVVSYGDNDGNLHSQLEHGNIFSKILNIRVSHH
jgi:hypothetical protein